MTNGTDGGVNSSEAGSPGSDLFVVGIGASAGGLQALESFFDNVPSDSGMAYVVIQHLSPDFKSLMDELLARHTKIPIYRVEDSMEIVHDAIYLIPPRKNMTLSRGRLLLSEQDPSRSLNLPIDLFFRSLAQDAGNRGIAVVLSGTGSDGSRGLKDVHEAGGLVVVQDVESAGFDGMPRNAMATEMADVITSPDKMPAHICRYAEDPSTFPRDDQAIDEPVLPGSELTIIFRLFRKRFGIDFTLYRPNTVHRRIERRMAMGGFASLAEYAAMLESNTDELDTLYRDVLVEVTQFFRDPRAFERLRTDVIQEIINNASGPRAEIRAWIAGCATGEEAYTIAMLLDECASQADKDLIIKVFATDVHRNSLEIASAGIYSEESLRNVPDDLRIKYFTRTGNHWMVSRELRQLVIFAPHDITKDPPFTRIDLLTCRNVLIYLDPAVQRRILSLFHFGMKVGGAMMLGPSESVADLAREFDTVDQHWRIFKKLRDVRLPEAKSIPHAPALTNIVHSKPEYPGVARVNNERTEAKVIDDLLDRYVPPSFLVNHHFELLHSFGEARQLLVQPKGRPTLDVLKMVEGDLRTALTAALHRGRREKERVVLQGIRLPTSDCSLQLVVEPYVKVNETLFLVCIEEIREQTPAYEPTAESYHAGDQAAQRVVDLERELDLTKQSLQSTVEELENSNEEMQSTNEELVASNEELQSTNEELHSVNEELYTVNAEHQRKIDELVRLTADMDNLLRSTEIGTVFLDADLCIRRFTPAIGAAFNLMEQDVGRPIHQFAYNFDNPELLDDLQRVLRTGEPFGREVSGPGSATYLKRIQCYRDADGKADGVVITFTDVSLLTDARAEERLQRAHLERINRDQQNFVFAVSHDLNAPLRQVQQFAIALQNSDAKNLSDEGTKSLAYVLSSTAKLKERLEALLEYSRVNTQGGQLIPTSCDEILHEVIESLKGNAAFGNADISMGKMPTVLADSKQLRTVFKHLLVNALNYRSLRPVKIAIAAERDEDDWVITVSDNGIGVPPQSLIDIFVIFKRLGFAKDVPGLGAGLALSKRIIERHNGTIHVESEVNKGSTFSIRLPAITQA